MVVGRTIGRGEEGARLAQLRVGQDDCESREPYVRGEADRILSALDRSVRARLVAPGPLSRRQGVVHATKAEVMASGGRCDGKPPRVERIERARPGADRGCAVRGRLPGVRRHRETARAPLHRVAVEVVHALRRVRGRMGAAGPGGVAPRVEIGPGRGVEGVSPCVEPSLLAACRGFKLFRPGQTASHRRAVEGRGGEVDAGRGRVQQPRDSMAGGDADERHGTGRRRGGGTGRGPRARCVRPGRRRDRIQGARCVCPAALPGAAGEAEASGARSGASEDPPAGTGAFAARIDPISASCHFAKRSKSICRTSHESMRNGWRLTRLDGRSRRSLSSRPNACASMLSRTCSSTVRARSLGAGRMPRSAVTVSARNEWMSGRVSRPMTAVSTASPATAATPRLMRRAPPDTAIRPRAARAPRPAPRRA